MGSQIICMSGYGWTPSEKISLAQHPYPRSAKRVTPRNGLAVPTLSVFYCHLHLPRVLHDHLCEIDTALEIADAVATSNGEDEAKAFDDACKQLSLRVTPTTRQNAIDYLKA